MMRHLKNFTLLIYFSSVLVYGYIPIFTTQPSVFLLVSLSLVSLSTFTRAFWYIVVPVLCCYGGYEGSVLFGDEFLISPLRHGGLGYLWFPCLLIRVSIFLLVQRGKIFRNPQSFQFMSLAAILVFILILGTFGFEIFYEGLPFLNKEPFRIVIFIFLSGLVLMEVEKLKLKQSVWKGILIATIVGALVRVGIITNFFVKDPGIFTYTGVFVCCAKIFLLSKYGKKDSFFPIVISFWVTILIMHIKPSRTELILLSISVMLLLVALRTKVIPIAITSILVGLWSQRYWPEDVLVYFQHKMNFFNAVIGGTGSIGDSANVRVVEFQNLIFGYGANLWSILFGRGAMGYINFEAFPNPSIYSEDSFSEIQYEIGMFYSLHFFATEAILYFGIVGLLLIIYKFFYSNMVRRVSPIEFILLAYGLLNCMYRTELFVLLPVILAAFRHQIWLLKPKIRYPQGRMGHAMVEHQRETHGSLA